MTVDTLTGPSMPYDQKTARQSLDSLLEKYSKTSGMTQKQLLALNAEASMQLIWIAKEQVGYTNSNHSNIKRLVNRQNWLIAILIAVLVGLKIIPAEWLQLLTVFI